MPEIDFPTALGTLLANREWRKLFARDRKDCLQRLSVRAADQDVFLAIDLGQLDAQVRTLLSKRMDEVSRLLPMTFCRLGVNTPQVFFDYAQEFWPRSHARHVEDAVAFGEYLFRQKEDALYQLEFNRVKFAHAQRRVALHVSRRVRVRTGWCPALQLLHRFGTRQREIIFYLAPTVSGAVPTAGAKTLPPEP